MLKPLLERKARLAEALKRAPAAVQYSDHIVGDGPSFLEQACRLKAEGVMSKRIDAPYQPNGCGGAWLKTKCLSREEFIVVGWTDPEGARPHLGALLLAYYAPDSVSCTPVARGNRNASVRAEKACSASEAACNDETSPGADTTARHAGSDVG